jgi:D-arabinose 1-dehydrogenase-like Zn-dependent alcohol dehydrogenase
MVPMTHRAWVWEGSADPDDLFLIELPLPAMEPGDVLVRNVTIGLNALDWRSLEGAGAEWRLGQVPGVDGAGVVVAVAEGVSQKWLGRRVSYHQNPKRAGAFAEYTAVPAHVLMRVPSTVSWSDAASLPCAALSAWLGFIQLPLACKRLLVCDIEGAVAHHLVQLAEKRRIFTTVIRHAVDAESSAKLDAEVACAGMRDDLEENPQVFDTVMVIGGDARSVGLESRTSIHREVIRIDDWPDIPASDRDSWRRLVSAGESLLDSLGRREWKKEVVREVPFELLAERLAGVKDGVFPERSIVRSTAPAESVSFPPQAMIC